MSVSATPQSPKPELSTVEPLLTSITASSADLYSFDCPRSENRIVEVTKHLRGRTVWGLVRRAVKPQDMGVALGLAAVLRRFITEAMVIGRCTASRQPL